MPLMPRLAILFFVCITCIGCDQGTKLLAIDQLQDVGTKSFWFDTLRLTYSENSGAFLGMGDSLPASVRLVLFQVLVSGFLLVLLGYIIKGKLTALEIAGYSLILAGGFSNFLDRVVNDGYVVDFLNVGLGAVRTGIFNVADVAILLGVLVVFAAGFQQRSPDAT